MGNEESTDVIIESFGFHIKVRSIEDSRKFYESLGFKAIFGYGDDEFRATIPEGVATAPEQYRGITYAASNGSTLEIAEGHIAISDRKVFGEEIKSPKISAMVSVSSLVPLLQSGALRPKFPVRHYYWGTIEAVVRDPDGFVVVLIAKYSEEEMDAVKAFVNVEEIESA